MQQDDKKFFAQIMANLKTVLPSEQSVALVYMAGIYEGKFSTCFFVYNPKDGIYKLDFEKIAEKFTSVNTIRIAGHLFESQPTRSNTRGWTKASWYNGCPWNMGDVKFNVENVLEQCSIDITPR